MGVEYTVRQERIQFPIEELAVDIGSTRRCGHKGDLGSGFVVEMEYKLVRRQ